MPFKDFPAKKSTTPAAAPGKPGGNDPLKGLAAEVHRLDKAGHGAFTCTIDHLAEQLGGEGRSNQLAASIDTFCAENGLAWEQVDNDNVALKVVPRVIDSAKPPQPRPDAPKP